MGLRHRVQIAPSEDRKRNRLSATKGHAEGEALFDTTGLIFLSFLRKPRAAGRRICGLIK